MVRQRLNQRGFRQGVLRAYPAPVVPNGLALCKLHHAALDSYIIGVTPDLEVKLRLDVLEEIDGPMLLHGLQGFQGRRIHVPRPDHLKPNRDFPAERYDLFRRAS
jgi:putative restriction endonuclease